jgi:hypothetical protein
MENTFGEEKLRFLTALDKNTKSPTINAWAESFAIGQETKGALNYRESQNDDI